MTTLKRPDRQRTFRLPGIQELSKQQDEALSRSIDGQHLIIGGPGTGKSVVALLRARRLVGDKMGHQFLVYNHVLHASTQQLFGQGLQAATWERWFRALFRQAVGEEIPTHEPSRPGGYRPIDWHGVEQRISMLPPEVSIDDPPHVVIDEGQDMPPAFYRALVNLGFTNFYVVADQNQQIHPEQCSSRQDIETALGLDPGDVLELTGNYRNSYPVAVLARAFYPTDPASPPPELPPLTKAAKQPLLVPYGADTRFSLEWVAERMLKMADRNPRKLIGVLTPNHQSRQAFFNALRNSHPRLDHEKATVQTYASGSQADLDFGKGGIMVINAQSCKGLEFDTVFLADIDEHQPKRDQIALKARFYVMVARAKEDVILLRSGPRCPTIESILPPDTNILGRYQ